MGKRREARELAIKVLYHIDINQGDPDEGFRLICECFGAPKTIRAFSRKLVRGVSEKKQDIDNAISRASKNWRVERMPLTDRSILRLGVFEILFLEDIPPKVSIDEAVELGKIYGTEDSAAFINGVLDRVYNDQVLEKKKLDH